MKIGKILDAIEALAPPFLQEAYDNSGLLTGNRNDEVKGALLSLDCTEEVVAEAVKKKCGLVISHHPVIFKPLKKITGASSEERTIRLALQKNIAIYACHTNLDNVASGVSAAMAARLGLQKTRVLKPLKGYLKKLVTFCPDKHADAVRDAIFSAGAGHIGNYDQCSFNLKGTGTFRGNDTTNPFVGKKNIQHREQETRIETIFPVFRQAEILKAMLATHPYEEVAYDIYPLDNEWPRCGAGMIGELPGPVPVMSFLQSVKSAFNSPFIRHTAPVKKSIRKVALCGGSGSFLLSDAIRSGADVYISSDFKYHEFFNADGKILVADIGHFESEQFTTGIFYDVLKRNFPKFAVRFSGVKTNPVNYF